MKTHRLDNSIDVSGEITWQYDSSPRISSLISGIGGLFGVSLAGLWSAMADSILAIDNANSFGLDMLGAIIGLKRQTISGSMMSDDLYRRVIKGRFSLIGSSYSVTDLVRFLEIAFGSAVVVNDNLDMSITYTLVDESDDELRKLFIGTNRDAFNAVFPFPAGVHSNNPVTRRMPFGLNDTVDVGQNVANFDHGSFSQ